jgi:hypothetical protein
VKPLSSEDAPPPSALARHPRASRACAPPACATLACATLACATLAGAGCADDLLFAAPAPAAALRFGDDEARQEVLLVALPPVVIGGSIDVNLRLASVGDVPVLVRSVALEEDEALCGARSGAFSLERMSDRPIATGRDRRVPLRFAPGDAAPACAVVVVETNDREVPALRALVRGRGEGAALCGPPALDFGPVPVGGARALPLALESCGTLPLEGLRLELAESAFSVSGASPASLAPGESFSLAALFSPRAEGAEEARLQATWSGGAAEVALSGSGVRAAGCALVALPEVIDFGAVAAGTVAHREALFRNVGDEECALSPVAPAEPFFVESLPASLPPGGAAVVTLGYAPPADADGAVHAGPSSPRPGAHELALLGRAAAPAPCGLVARPAAVSFGVVAPGAAAAARELLLENPGAGACRIESLATTGPFSLAAGPAPQGTLLPGASVAVSVAPAAVADGPLLGALVVVASPLEAAAPSAHRLEVPLSAVGVAPRLCLEPAVIDFGLLEPGAAASQSLSVRSCGGAPLSVSQLALEGPSALSLVGVPPLPRVLAPGDAMAIAVRAAPRGPDAGSALTGTIAVSSDDPGRPRVEVPVALAVTAATACGVTPRVLVISGPATGAIAPQQCTSGPCPQGHWLQRWFFLSRIEAWMWAGESLAPSALRARGITQVWVVPPDGSHYAIANSDLENLLAFAEQGGSLVLLADNVPFISVSNHLAQALGVSFVRSPLGDMGTMTRAAGQIRDHCTTRGIDAMNAGITPSHVDFPPGDPRFTLAAQVDGEHLMVAFEEGEMRVVFDSAFTHYQFFTQGVAVADWVRNVAFFGACGCDAPWELGVCAAGPAECGEGLYTACTCDPFDPCDWARDGVCDATSCAQVVDAHFDDGADCR